MATHRRVLQWLENELFDGNLVLGQQLPSDRDLASVLGVNRGTMREALKILEAQGVLRLYEGSRKTILPMLVREPAASAGPALQLHMATADYPLRDIVQTRVLLETWALTNADHRSPAMAELRTLLREMGRDDISLKEFHHLYVSFHIALVKTANNTLVAALMSALRDSIYEYTMALVGHVPLWSKTVDRIRAEHQAIFSAVLAGDNNLAARLVEEHIEYQYVEAGVDPERGPRAEAQEVAGPTTGPLASGRVWSNGADDVDTTSEHTPVKEAVALQVAKNSGASAQADAAQPGALQAGEGQSHDDLPGEPQISAGDRGRGAEAGGTASDDVPGDFDNGRGERRTG